MKSIPSTRFSPTPAATATTATTTTKTKMYKKKGKRINQNESESDDVIHSVIGDGKERPGKPRPMPNPSAVAPIAEYLNEIPWWKNQWRSGIAGNGSTMTLFGSFYSLPLLIYQCTVDPYLIWCPLPLPPTPHLPPSLFLGVGGWCRLVPLDWCAEGGKKKERERERERERNYHI